MSRRGSLSEGRRCLVRRWAVCPQIAAAARCSRPARRYRFTHRTAGRDVSSDRHTDSRHIEPCRYGTSPRLDASGCAGCLLWSDGVHTGRQQVGVRRPLLSRKAMFRSRLRESRWLLAPFLTPCSMRTRQTARYSTEFPWKYSLYSPHELSASSRTVCSRLRTSLA